MKNYFVLICFILFLPLNTNAYVFYGLPSSDAKINKGDIIILNIPININGRFVETAELNDLITFINLKDTLQFRIEINYFHSSSEFNKDYSQKLKQNLQKILDKNCCTKNYSVKAYGENNLIFIDEDSEQYRFFNTRLEIIIE